MNTLDGCLPEAAVPDVGAQEYWAIDAENPPFDGAGHHSANTRYTERLVNDELDRLLQPCCPLVTLRREIDEEPQKLEALAGDRGGQEDGRQGLGCDSLRACDDVLHVEVCEAGGHMLQSVLTSA